MEPRYHTGDLVLVEKHASYHAGELIAYRVPKGDPMAGAQVIHRIIGGDAKHGFVVHGDNRTAPDVWRPKAQDIVGAEGAAHPDAIVVLQYLRPRSSSGCSRRRSSSCTCSRAAGASRSPSEATETRRRSNDRPRCAASSATSHAVYTPRVVPFAHRRYFVTFVAVAGLGATWGAMLAFSWSAKLGIVTFAPWVALVGFDLGVVAGVAAAGIATSLYLIATHYDTVDARRHPDRRTGRVARSPSRSDRRSAAAACGRARRAPRGCRAPVGAHRLDARRDLPHGRGGQHPHLEPPAAAAQSRSSACRSHGTVPERLLALADVITEPDRYRAAHARARTRAAARRRPTSSRWPERGACFRGYTAPVPEAAGGLAGGSGRSARSRRIASSTGCATPSSQRSRTSCAPR